MKRYDGEYRWVLDHGVPLSEDEAFAGFVGSSIDITDRKSTEEERATLLHLERAAREESERVNRVKDEFLATLSHELRTPLSAILGWAHVLRAHADNEQVVDAVQRIERNARTQARIIEDLLDMSRIISGKIQLSFESVDFDGVVLAAVEAVTPAATTAGIGIRVERESKEHIVSGDSDRLQQILVNLLANAVKFSSPGDAVEVRVREREGLVECEVEDHGRGIAPEFLPHVFERFRQADASTSRNQTGLGLGLAIVKNLVELHGGTIEAHSAGWGRGALFRVRLPRGSAERTVLLTPQRGSGAVERPKGDALSGTRILIVDDDADARDLLERVLRSHGAQLSIASSAADGLAEFRRARPDVIVSDIGMPGADGYAFIRDVRELERERGGHQVPAIALTAFARREDRQQVLNAGYQEYVAKPFQPDALVRSLVGLASLR
jgi:signal transduction histidine kinase